MIQPIAFERRIAQADAGTGQQAGPEGKVCMQVGCWELAKSGCLRPQQTAVHLQELHDSLSGFSFVNPQITSCKDAE